MKAMSFILASLFCAGVAAADPYYGPPGNYPAPVAAPAPAGLLVPASQVPLRQAILARFDRNGDGVLEPQERRQAIRALRRLTRRMARQEVHAERQARRARQAAGGGDFE